MAQVEEQLPALEAIAQQVSEAIRNGGKVLTCGNGGSAAEAQHFAEELVGRYKATGARCPPYRWSPTARS